MELILVRHPQPDVAPGICYGRSDVPASPAVIAAVAQHLRNAGLPGALPIYASPLKRCADLATQLDTSVTFDARLAEMDFGAWEMRPWDDIPRAEVDAWSADLLHYRPGGGENVMDVARRVAAFFANLRQAGHARVLLVCHAGSMRLLAALHAGGSVEAAALRAASEAHRIDYGGIIVLKD
jgi:alpha-ribazole phosphatase